MKQVDPTIGIFCPFFLSENKVEGEDSWMTVSCLRGRLLAERMASRNAREEADQLGIRVHNTIIFTMLNLIIIFELILVLIFAIVVGSGKAGGERGEI